MRRIIIAAVLAFGAAASFAVPAAVAVTGPATVGAWCAWGGGPGFCP